MALRWADRIAETTATMGKALDSLRRLVPDDRLPDADKRIARAGRAKQRLTSFVSIPLNLLKRRKRRSGRVDVNACVAELVKLLEPITAHFNLELQPLYANGYAVINGSEALIDGICLNLVMNSINAFQRDGFQQPSRVIRFETRQDETHLLLIVEDNAGGIDGLDLNDIWVPGITTAPEGTGFGLTIVRDSVPADEESHLMNVHMMLPPASRVTVIDDDEDGREEIMDMLHRDARCIGSPRRRRWNARCG